MFCKKRRKVLALFGGMIGAGTISSNAHSLERCSGVRFEVKKCGNQWCWTLVSSNGRPVASHGGYNARQECIAATRRLAGIATSADGIIEEDCE